MLSTKQRSELSGTGSLGALGRRRRWVASAAATAMLGTALCGCLMPAPPGPQVTSQGRVYYVDGAGGGGPLVNWGRGVREGLEQAGLGVTWQDFHWQTGLGVAADQMTSVEYKRAQAAQLSGLIQADMARNTGLPINLVGFSAGTAVVVYALEALPPGCSVDSVVLIGSSLSSGYDLTTALKHVRSQMYVLTSPKDDVLRLLVPIAGTADRIYCGEAVAGLRGFKTPTRHPSESLGSYTKLRTVAWSPEFAAAGHYGGHTDAVTASFVRSHVAPLLDNGLADEKGPPASATALARSKEPPAPDRPEAPPAAQVPAVLTIARAP